jgi:dihydrofolate synthase/folylpolyglutamate synthase
MSRSLSDWLEYIERQHPSSIAMGLERVRAVAARLNLGPPARQTITVGGTNGKGSTVAFLEAIARAHGLRVGTYTSPHLLRYNERVCIDGCPVEDAALIAGFEAVEAARGAIPLTYFEYGTLCALWLFQRAGLDLAVLEVGLGGRLDAVNLVDADAAIITTVDLDHQQWLGPDTEAIGYEKAGIARPFKPLILGDDDPPSSVLRHAYAIGAPAWRIANDFFAELVDDAHWRWRDVGCELLLPLPMGGGGVPAQLRNAACAIAAWRALDLPLEMQAIAQSVATARVPGRLQRFGRDGVDVLVDVGHNPQAARALMGWLQAQPARPTRAVYAALADKDIAGVVTTLATAVPVWHLAGSQAAGARGMEVTALRQRLQDVPLTTVFEHEDVVSALQAALRQAAAETGRVLVLGSFHAAAEALRWLD